MKQAWKYIIGILIYTSYNVAMDSAENPHSISKSTPYSSWSQQQTIKYACLCVGRGYMTLNRFFKHILPPEIAHYIIELAYKKDFHNFFFCPDKLRLFLPLDAYYFWPTDDTNIPQTVFSPIAITDACTHIKNVTYATVIENEKYSATFDGTYITIQNGLNHLVFEYTSPVTALMKNNTDLITGHEDGSVLFYRRKVIVFPQLCSSTVSCIASAQLPNTYLIGFGNTVFLGYLQQCGKKHYSFEGKHLIFNTQKGKPYSIKTVGTDRGSILIQTNKDKYFTVLPYDYDDYNTIKECTFSPAQASRTYNMIQHYKLSDQSFLPRSDA